MNERDLREAIRALIVDKIGVDVREVLPDADIEHDLGCTGDDFAELIEEYARRFRVNMTGYRWYFHTHDESMATFNPFIGRPESTQVKRIPVTLDVLVEMATSREWSIVYPPHKLEQRYTRTQKVVRTVFIIGLIVLIVRSCFH